MNVLLVVADALRADHLSCYGYHRNTSPNIDKLAYNHVKYESAFTPSTWTRSAAASLLTGTYPSVHGVKTMNDQFGANAILFPYFFQEQGYDTIGISGIGNVSSGLGFNKGFDEFIDLYKDTELIGRRPSSNAKREMLEHASGEVVFPRAADVIDRFEEKLSSNGIKEPFFSLLWLIDPHDPYQPPDDFQFFVDDNYIGAIDGTRAKIRTAKTEEQFEHLVNLYDSEIRYLDYQIGRLTKLLEQENVWENTLLIITSDHGEAFGDHGRNVGHSNVHFEELIHVPLIIRYPSDGSRWKGKGSLVNLIDIIPTVIDFLDMSVNYELPSEVMGRSVLDGGRQEVFSETHYSQVQNSFYSIRGGKWKYIAIESPKPGISAYVELLSNIKFIQEFLSNPLYFLRRRFGGTDAHLYDLVRDPKEEINLVAEFPEISDRFESKLQRWKKLTNTFEENTFGREVENIDDKTIQQLEEMGYLG